MPVKYRAVESIAAFWAKVDKHGPAPTHRPELGACWLWTGATDSRGYGKLKRDGKTLSAPHFAWELHAGPIPIGRWVLHHCDVPGCVRPAHLFTGTAQDNSEDMIRKGRHRGFNCGALSPQQVIEIRGLDGSGLLHREIAARYGVAASTIGKIIRGQSRRAG